MHRWRRYLLIALLAIALPAQGWAAAWMSVTTAAGMAEPSAVLATAAEDEAAMSALSGHHEHACCDPQAEGAHADHDGSPCGDHCHCCIVAATTAPRPIIEVTVPAHDWLAALASACATGPSATPDKPPKA